MLAAASEMGHSYVGTQHILVACHRDPTGMMAMVLDGLGATSADIGRHVDAALQEAS